MSYPVISGAVGGCTTCAYQIRSVGGELEPGGDPTNIVNWTNAYDITTVAWGQCLTGYFTDPSHTTPDSTGTNPCTGGVGYPENLTSCVGWNEGFTACTYPNACAIPTVYRSQFLIVVPTAYYVIAYGNDISNNPPEYRNCGEGGDWFASGCIYPLLADTSYPLIVDLPIPDNTLDTTIAVQYYWLGIIQPGASIPGGGVFTTNMTILPNLSSLTPSNAGCAGFGPNWASSIATPCDGPVNDPFTDDSPP